MIEQRRPYFVDPRQNPRFVKALGMLQEAVSAQRLGRNDEADRLYAKLVKKNPDYFDALNFYGLFKYQLGQHQAAFDLLKKATRLHPRSASALNNLGIVLCHLKRPDEAIEVFERALALDPSDANSLNNRGNALLDLDDVEPALASFDAAIRAQPNFINAYINRGRALMQLESYEEALTNYDRALTFAPLDPGIYNNRGAVLHKLHRMEQALASFDRAIALRPNFADAYCNRGTALRDINRHQDAFTDFEKTLALKPDSAEAWCGLGSIFNTHRRYEAAYEAYSKALALNPKQERAMAPRIHAKMQLCDWSGLDEDFTATVSALRNDVLIGDPFSLLCVPASPADHLHCARLFASQPSGRQQLWNGERYSHDRIRVAYLSADLRNHAVGWLVAGALEAHDRSRFAVTALSIGPLTNDALQLRLRNAVERFLDVEARTDREISQLIRDLEIDILVDLNGFTQNSRTFVMAQRPAPIQVNYLGYSGTMGVDYIDYIIADETVLPREHTAFFAEKAVWLPDSYMASDDKRPLAERTPTRAECGLPDNAFVFCCFNQTYKITPEVFRIWMKVLKAIEGSVLWLSAGNSIAEANLRREAERHGVATERLVFAPILPEMADHLARQRQADLFLDTLPYNAHTTANDALWVGLPVLTRLGEAFHGRVAASLIQTAGLPELITTSGEVYESLAIELARDRGKLAILKQKLANSRATTALFNSKLFTRRLETAYRAMYERYQAGLAPDHIIVSKHD
jgi:protein O-GlcNAc transferase